MLFVKNKPTVEKKVKKKSGLGVIVSALISSTLIFCNMTKPAKNIDFENIKTLEDFRAVYAQHPEELCKNWYMLENLTDVTLGQIASLCFPCVYSFNDSRGWLTKRELDNFYNRTKMSKIAQIVKEHFLIDIGKKEPIMERDPVFDIEYALYLLLNEAAFSCNCWSELTVAKLPDFNGKSATEIMRYITYHYGHKIVWIRPNAINTYLKVHFLDKSELSLDFENKTVKRYYTKKGDFDLYGKRLNPQTKLWCYTKDEDGNNVEHNWEFFTATEHEIYLLLKEFSK